MSKKRSLLAATLLSMATVPLLLSPPASAQAGSAASATDVAAPLPVTTRHVGVFGGHSVSYSATVEGVVVSSGPDRSSARVVSFAYLRDGADPHTRPVMFLFNGGPIVASAYVHLGGLGPKRIAFPDDVKADPGTFQLVDNPYSPLDAVDLVFVDPASTGFSRVMPGTKPESYFSIPTDAAQFGAFVRAWLRAHGRVGAPVYLFGESYGTNRAATIAGQLSEGPEPLRLSGVFLYGQALNIVEYSQRPTNIISYAASLPTIAAIAWYHGKAEAKGRSRARFMADAWTFARGPYLTALYRGAGLEQPERRRIAVALEQFSGIPAAWYLGHDLRMTKEQYRVELLKERKLLLGRNDARYIAAITASGGAPDPSDVLGDAILRAFPHYLRDELGVVSSVPYIPVAQVGDGLSAWGWGFGTSPFGDWPYQRGISKMMARNPRARVVVANGVYDTQTTMGAAELLINQSGWDRSRTTLRFYDGGHMGYSVAATAKAMGEDIRALVR